MKLTHDFLVRLPVAEAWTVLTDLERIAPCMPGVHLDSVADDEFGGRLKVKVGPITADYAGAARFVERDVEAWTVVWRAEGRETRGKGNAAATVTMELSPSEGGTRVQVLTDLAISGRLAQFGRGVLGEVSNRLLAQFVTALEREVAGDRVPTAAATTNGRAPASAVPAAPTTGPAPNLAALAWPDDEPRPIARQPAYIDAQAVRLSRERPRIPRDTDKTGPGTPGFNLSGQHRQKRAHGGADGEPGPRDGSLDLLAAVAVPVGKRLLVAGAVVAAVVLAVRWFRR